MIVTYRSIFSNESQEWALVRMGIEEKVRGGLRAGSDKSR